MSIVLKENETMEDVVKQLGFASEWVYEIAPIAYWYENLHENGRIRDIHFSRRMREMLGYTSEEEFPDELNTLMTFTHPDDIHIMLDDAIAAATGRIEKYDVRYRLRRADGSYAWCNATGKQVKNHEGVIIGMYGAFIDISREIALKEEQQALSEVLQDDAVFLIDCVNDTRKTFHDRLYGASKYTDAENYSAAFARYVDSFVCKPDYEMMRSFVDPGNILALLGNRKELRIQYRETTTGIQRFYEMRITRFSDTEVLQSFKETDAEMVNRLLLEKLRDDYFALFCVDLESGLVRSFKADPMNIVGAEGNVSSLSSAMNSLASHFTGDVRAFFEKNSSPEFIRESFAKKDKSEYTYRSSLDDGTKWAKVTGIVLQRNDSGIPEIFCIGFSFLDEQSSKLRTTQEQLYAESQRSSLFFDAFDAGKWSYEIGANDEIISANYSDAVHRNTNIPSFSGRPMGWIDRVHPEDRESILKQFMAAIWDHTGNTKYDVNFRVIDIDGKTRWTKSAGRVIRRADGTGEFFGMNVDITDEVEEQEKYLAQKVVAAQFIRNFIKDYGTVFRVNTKDNSCSVLKRSENMRTGKPAFDNFSETVNYLLTEIVYEADRERVRRMLNPDAVMRELAKNSTCSIEYRVKAGWEVRWDEMKISMLDDTFVAVGFAVKNREIILRHLQEKEYENYYAIFSIDVDAGQITNIKNESGYGTGTVGSVAPYSTVMKAFADSLEGDAKDFFLRMSDIENVRKIHSAEDKLTYVYQSVLDHKKRWIRATSYTIIRHENGEPAVVTLGFNFMDSMSAERQNMAEELARMTAVANYFVKSYSSAYYCDIRNGEVVILHANPVLMERIAGKEISYEKMLSVYTDEFVHPEDRETVHTGLSGENIRENLKEADEFSFTFRVIAQNNPGIYRCTIIRGADEYHIGVGFRNVTEEIKKDEELQRIDSLIRTFAGEYEAVFIANLRDGSYKAVTNIKGISDIFDGKGTFGDALDRYTSEMIHPLDRDRAQSERIPLERTGQGIAVGESHSVEYRSKTEDGYSWYRGTMSRLSEDMLMVGFKNCNEEKITHLVENVIIGELDALYMVNLDMDEIRPVRASRISRVGNITGKLVYSKLCSDFAQTVAPRYKEDWIRFGSIAYMKAYMAELDRREYVYELPEAGNAMRRFTVNVVERANGEAKTLLLSFTGIDDLRAQSILLERRVAEQSAFTKYFLNTYDSAYYVGFNDRCWQVFKQSGKLAEAYPEAESYSEVLEKYIADEVHTEDRETVSILLDPGRLKQQLCVHPSFSFTFRQTAKTEESIFRCEVIRGADEDHAAFGFRNITDEVAEELKHQEELHNALETAQYANRAKTDFLFNMSHDIRTPMNAIIGFTDRAIRNRGNAALVDDSLRKLKSSSEYMLQIINDILDMARIESGRLEIRENLRYVEGGNNALIEIMASEADRKDIRFHTSYNTRDKYIWVDHGHSSQIVANILSNAIKYTNSGGDIWYSVEQLPCDRPGYGKYAVSIKDNGIGMSPEFIQRIFDPFEREQSSTVSGVQGTGLGMAIVKRIVDAMGGTIEIHSQQGVGTEVIFTSEHRLATPEEIERFNRESEEKENQKVTSFDGLRILLVEDNELNREIASDILEEEGITVESAEDGSIAVAMLKEKGAGYYDFILMDIQMPVMDGYQATEAIRRMYPDAAIPIIAVSANAFDEDKARSRAAGMNDHVAKPINIDALKAALAKFL